MHGSMSAAGGNQASRPGRAAPAPPADPTATARSRATSCSSNSRRVSRLGRRWQASPSNPRTGGLPASVPIGASGHQSGSRRARSLAWRSSRATTCRAERVLLGRSECRTSVALHRRHPRSERPEDGYRPANASDPLLAHTTGLKRGGCRAREERARTARPRRLSVSACPRRAELTADAGRVCEDAFTARPRCRTP